MHGLRLQRARWRSLDSNPDPSDSTAHDLSSEPGCKRTVTIEGSDCSLFLGSWSDILQEGKADLPSAYLQGLHCGPRAVL